MRPTQFSPLFVMTAAMIFTLSVAEPATAQTMKINISLPRDSHQGVAIDTFAREVQKRTNGRYHIRTFYSGELGDERESVEAVQRGTLELTYTSTGPIPNFVPEVAILDIPFLFRDYVHARALLDGPIGQLLLAKFRAKGIVALVWAENGFRHMTNNRRAINVPDDAKGLKMRTMENLVHIRAYRQFGIIPTPMPFSKLFSALQQGIIDGQENPLSVITSAKFHRVQKYLSLTGHVYSPALILMHEKLWDKLSEADQQAFREAAAEAARANRSHVDEDEKKAVSDLRNKGMSVVENLDKSKFQEVLAPVYEEFAKKFGQENIDSIRYYK